METKTLEINGISFPVVKLPRRDFWILCKISGDQYSSYKYANRKQAYMKVLELEMNGVKAEVRNIGRPFCISIEVENEV